MVFPLLIAAVLGVTPTNDAERSVAVIPVNQTELGKQLEKHVRDALISAQVPLASVLDLNADDPKKCETNRLCFALLGRVLGTFAVVRVEAASVGSDIAVLIEALESSNGRVIREESFVIPTANIDSEMPLRLAPIAAKILSALPAQGPPKAIVLALEQPPLENPALDLTHPGVQPRSAVPIWVTGTGAVIFAGASAGLLAVGASARNCLHGPPVDRNPTVCVPHAQTPGVQQRADVGLITGTAAAAIAVGLAVTAIVQHLSN